MSKEELEIISRRFEDKLAQLMPQEEFLPFVRCVVEEARLMVENAPTVDAVEVVAKNETTTDVVRCKDCRHRDPEDHKCDSGALERVGCAFPVADDYFCSWGERREDEDE